MKQGESIISTDLRGPGSVEADDAEASAEAELRAFVIDAALHGQRLDRALVALVPEFSRSYLQQLIDDGAVKLQQRAVTRASHRVKAGDQGQVQLRATPQSQAFRAEPMALRIVYEDEHLLVIDKPAGLVVHPAPGNWSGTLLNGLLAYDARAADLPRAGIVHRLDKDTSGLMVVARTRQTMDALVRLISAREVTRQYLAMAHRPWNGAPHRDVEAAIGRDPRDRLRMAVVDLERHPGKPASTRFDLLANAEAGCLVRASLRTGRTHQIRVHMAHLGHPLVGDTLYGGSAAAGMTRQALHAYRLAFVHPASQQPMAFEAPAPHDLAAGLAAWGLRYNDPDGPTAAHPG